MIVNQQGWVAYVPGSASSGALVAAIAEALGFEEATNFVKFFKRETRVTPGAFRRQHLRFA
jgi:AraC-like DNA-binding protein